VAKRRVTRPRVDRAKLAAYARKLGRSESTGRRWAREGVPEEIRERWGERGIPKAVRRQPAPKRPKAVRSQPAPKKPKAVRAKPAPKRPKRRAKRPRETSRERELRELRERAEKAERALERERAKTAGAEKPPKKPPKKRRKKPQEPKRKPARVPRQVLERLRRQHAANHAQLDIETSWGWGRRTPDPTRPNDAGSFSLRTEALIKSVRDTKDLVAELRREVPVDPLAKKFSVTYAIACAVGDLLNVRGSNRDTFGEGADALDIIFDKLKGEFSSTDAAWAAFGAAIDAIRAAGGNTAFYVERVVLHEYKK